MHHLTCQPFVRVILLCLSVIKDSSFQFLKSAYNPTYIKSRDIKSHKAFFNIMEMLILTYCTRKRSNSIA